MKETNLKSTAQQLVSKGKGILAADESVPTAGKRLKKVGLSNTEENRRRYRNLFLPTEGIEEGLSGVILFDETLYQKANNGRYFLDILQEKEIIPGIKVDQGRMPLPGSPEEVYTKGIDDLRSRLKEYSITGAGFTKYRTVVRIDEQLEIPTEHCIQTGAQLQGLYAAISQEYNVVPVVEPEVLLDGSHTIERAEDVTTRTLQETFDRLDEMNVDLEGMLLKSSMVLPGDQSGQDVSAEQIGEATVRCLRNSVPEDVPGVVFLSGGQSPEQATRNLNAINNQGSQPWELSFSFGRALQGPSLEVWDGDSDNVSAAREAFQEQIRKTSVAREGNAQQDSRSR